MNASTRRLAYMAAVALLAVAALAGGCADGGETGPIAIQCQVYGRPSPGEQFEESIIALGPGNATGSEDLYGLTFSAQFVDDPGEGPALSLVVSDAATGAETARQLYQIDRETGLVNQFVGGHGFTGLHYVYHPTSSAEVQYFCQAE